MVPNSHQKEVSQPASYILFLLVSALAVIANLPSIFTHVVILEVCVYTCFDLERCPPRQKSRVKRLKAKEKLE